LISSAVAVFAGTAAAGLGALWAKSAARKNVTISAEMEANPYHPDWKGYTGTDRGVGADAVKNEKNVGGTANDLANGAVDVTKRPSGFRKKRCKILGIMRQLVLLRGQKHAQLAVKM
jgi:hypothetical protein